MGGNTVITSDTGTTVQANPLPPECETSDVPTFNDESKCECHHANMSHVFVIRNDLSVPAMHDNSMPPFAMKEVVVHVEDVTEIHTQNSTINCHPL